MVHKISFKRVKYPKKREFKLGDVILFVLLGLLLFSLLVFIFNRNDAKSGEVISEEQEQQEDDIALIRFVIEIINAWRLDEDREVVSDIYPEVSALDDVWSDTIHDGEYARVKFEQPLTSENDITIYPRVVSGNPRIEVYEENENDLIAEFTSLTSNEYNQILLTNLQGSQDTFDLRVLDGSLQFDHVIDPPQFARPDADKQISTWTDQAGGTTNIFQSIDEVTADDADYIESISNPLPTDIYIANLSDVTDPEVSTDHIIRWRYAKDASAGRQIDFNLTLKQSDGTVIASRQFTGVSDVVTQDNYTLSAAEADAITNYAELEVHIWADAVGGGAGRTGRSHWVEFEVPEAGADNPPKWFDNSTNSTLAGEAVEHRVRWTDETNLAGYIFSFDNGTGSFVNDSFVVMTGTNNWSNVTKVVNSTEGSTIKWIVYANDSTDQWNVTDTFQYTTTLDNPPKWSSPSNTPASPNPGQSVSHNVSWTDDNTLSYATLEVNSTGASCNTAANVSETTLSGASDWANLSWSVENACEGQAIGWRQWANDSIGQWNVTDTQVYVVQNVAPTASFGTNPVDTFNSSSNSITFDLKVSDNLNVDALRLYGNWTGSWAINQTNMTAVNDSFWNVTVTGIPEGIHRWAAWGNDTLGNEDFTDTNRTFTVDTTAPNIDFVSPTEANDSSLTRNYIQVNVTASDSLTGLDTITIFLYNSTSLVQTNTSTTSPLFVNFTGLPDETYYFNSTANDTLGNENQTLTRTVTIDTGPPTVNYVSPTENSGVFKSQDYIEINVTATDSNLDNILIRLYNSSNEQINSSTTTSSPNFINFTGLANGIYFYNATANDTFSNEADLTTRNITLDTINPAVTIFEPQNISYNTDSLTINFTATDTNLDECWYTDDGGASNNTLAGCANTTYTAPQGSTTLRIYVNDSAGNLNSTETVTFFVDSINPQIEYTTGTEANDTSKNQQFIFVNVSVTETNFDNITYKLYNSTGELNKTTYTTLITNINWTGLLNENIQYWYNVSIYDTVGNFNETETRYITLTQDQPPIVNVTFPLNQTYNVDVTELNYTASDDNPPLSACWYSINSGATNITITCGNNVTGLTSDEGGNTWTVYANDSAGQESSDSVTFTKDTTNPNIDFVSPTEANDSSLTRNYIQINVTASDTNLDTITIFLYNSTSLVQTNTSSTSPFFTNFTSLTDEVYYFNSTVNDTAGNENQTETRTVTLDTGPPSVSSLTESPADPATFSESQTYQFNATVSDPNLDTVVIEFDNVNYSTTNPSGNIYSFDISNLSVGTYNYRWYANDTFGNLNGTENSSYTINQATPSLSIAITPSTSETYETETTATGSNCPSQLTCNLYRDSVSVSNPETATLGVGTYNYTYNTTGNTNYTSDSVSDILTISQATGVVFTYLDNSRANKTIEQFTEIYLNSTLETGSGTIELYNNGTLINQGASPLSNLTNFTTIALYNITTIYSGNANYTSASETWWVNVTEADVTPPNIQIDYPANTTYNAVQTQLNYTASDNIGLDTCWYSLDSGATNTTVTCGQNVTGLDSGQGSSTWRVYANDSKGNENSSSVTFFVDSVIPTISFVAPTETSGDSLGRNYIQVNVTASDTNLDKIIIRLYNSSSDLINSSTTSTSPNFINFTGLSAGTYFFNATANDTANNENSTATRNVSLVVPTLTIILPENETYIDNESLLLNYTTSLEDFVWYNIDSGSNTTITGNTTFNTTTGQHTLFLYANNTNGETAKSIIFTVNLTKFTVTYNEFDGSLKGTSTDFNKSSYEDLQNLSNVILENTDHGKIEFNETINLTNDADLTDNKIDLDNYINISSNRIEVNSTALPNFNKSATLYLYNLAFSNPRILRDEVVCPSTICVENSYSGGTLSFNATGFTVYSAEETPADEDDTGGGAGGGGAGGGVECTDNSQCEGGEVCWNYQCAKLFDIKIIDFESPVKLGDFFKFSYLVKGIAEINGDVEIDFWIERNNEIITAGKDVIYLGSFEERTETTKIFLPSGFESGIYEFHVRVSHPSYSAESFRTIEVQVKEGIAIIGPLELGNIRKYIIFSLVILAFVILAVIFYIERRKFIKEFIQETRWVKKHKTTVLVFSLFVVLGLIIYFSNFIESFSRFVLEINLWFRASILPYIIFILVIGIVLLLAFLLLKNLRKKNFFEKLMERRRKKKILKRLKKKHEEKEVKGRGLLKIFSSSILKFFRMIPRVIKAEITAFGRGFRNITKVFSKAEFELKTDSESIGKRIFYVEKKFRGFKPPKLDLTKQFNELKKVKLKFRLPELKKPEEMKWPKFRLPRIKFKRPELRLRDIRLPRFKLSKIKLRFKLPELEKPRDIRLPRFKLSRIFSFKKEREKLKKIKKIPIKAVKKSEKTLGKILKEDIGRIKRFRISMPKINFKKYIRKVFREADKSIEKLKPPRVNLSKLFRFKKEKELFKKEKELIRKGEKKIGKGLKEASEFGEEIHKEVSRALTAAFGEKTWKPLVNEFRKAFAGKKEHKKEHSELLKELGRLKTKLEKGENMAEKKLIRLRKKADAIIRDLSVYVKKMHLPHEVSELKKSLRIKKDILNIKRKMKEVDNKVIRFLRPEKKKAEDAIKKFFQKAKNKVVVQEIQEEERPVPEKPEFPGKKQEPTKPKEDKEEDIIENIAKKEQAEKDISQENSETQQEKPKKEDNE